jgi:hypothetical protein
MAYRIEAAMVLLFLMSYLCVELGWGGGRKENGRWPHDDAGGSIPYW